jgi:hypothetical protein
MTIASFRTNGIVVAALLLVIGALFALGAQLRSARHPRALGRIPGPGRPPRWLSTSPAQRPARKPSATASSPSGRSTAEHRPPANTPSATTERHARVTVRGGPGDDEIDRVRSGLALVLPYLRRMESDANFGDRSYHGAVGPIPVQRLARDQWGPADDALAESALGLGYGWCEDHNAPTGTGVSPYGISARDGARVTTNDAYLEPARERENLRVFGGATVDNVLVEGGRATGAAWAPGASRCRQARELLPTPSASGAGDRKTRPSAARRGGGCVGLPGCRRRDSNPRPSDHDPSRIWLSHRGFRAGWTRRWTQPPFLPSAIPRVPMNRLPDETTSRWSVSETASSAARNT